MPENIEWLDQNRKAIVARLSGLAAKPEGIIYKKSSDTHDIVILKTNRTHLHLLFIDPTSQEIMSRIDLNDPLYLLAPYTQAAMLSLLWVEKLSRVYVLGFGGGRIPMLLHHYYPDVVIESTEIDTDVIELAKKYFAIELDSRLQVYVEDGRKYIADKPAEICYDIIMIDAFHGNGYGPYPLSTEDFYKICKSHMTENSVLIFNLLTGDTLYTEKIKTLASVFKNAYLIKADGAHILFGTDLPQQTIVELLDKAKEIQSKHKFSFPFVELVDKLQNINELPEYSQFLEGIILLTDANPPEGYFDTLSVESTIYRKAGRNDPCPCGSGKKFKNCHGRLKKKT